MKRISSWAALVVITFGSARAHAADFYVATDGDDEASGTLSQPFATVERAQQAASPGDTVYIRGGVYAFSGTADAIGVAFTKSGQPDRPIRYFAYENEVPIFDLFQLRPQQRVTGLDVRASYLHLRGLEVRGVRQLIVGDSWSVRIRGDHNLLERLNVHDGEAPGIFITPDLKPAPLVPVVLVSGTYPLRNAQESSTVQAPGALIRSNPSSLFS